MGNAWDTAKEMADKADTGGLYLRLKSDGDKACGVFVGEPYPHETIWNGERNVEADSAEGRDLMGEGNRPRLRVKLNFYNFEVGQCQIWEVGSKLFKDILKLRQKYGLDEWAFEIERRGGAGDPKTTYSVLPDHKLTEGELTDVAAADVHDLAQGDISFP